tara:strand:- start:96 stop:539 length:444 start_codon:yes stop_codon:yes gene_type:complete
MSRPYKSATKSDLQKEIDIEIGKILKQARVSRGINKKIYDASGCIVDIKRVHKPCTQTELAKVLDCTFQQIQKFEHGKNTLNLYKTFLAANFLNIHIEKFLNVYKLKLNSFLYTLKIKDLHTKLVGQYEPPINSSNKDRDCSLSQEL